MKQQNLKDQQLGLYLSLNNKKVSENKSPEKQRGLNRPPLKSTRDKNATIIVKQSLTHRGSQQPFTGSKTGLNTNNKTTPIPLFKKVSGSGLPKTSQFSREREL